MYTYVCIENTMLTLLGSMIINLTLLTIFIEFGLACQSAILPNGRLYPYGICCAAGRATCWVQTALPLLRITKQPSLKTLTGYTTFDIDGFLVCLVGSIKQVNNMTIIAYSDFIPKHFSKSRRYVLKMYTY